MASTQVYAQILHELAGHGAREVKALEHSILLEHEERQVRTLQQTLATRFAIVKKEQEHAARDDRFRLSHQVVVLREKLGAERKKAELHAQVQALRAQLLTQVAKMQTSKTQDPLGLLQKATASSLLQTGKTLTVSEVMKVGLFCSLVGLFCSLVGLFCSLVGLFCSLVGLFCSSVGLFCSSVGLFCSSVGLFCLLRR